MGPLSRRFLGKIRIGIARVAMPASHPVTNHWAHIHLPINPFIHFPHLQIVIGSGPAGQKCAIDAVKRGYRVAMVDKNSQMGGVCVVCRSPDFGVGRSAGLRPCDKSR